MRVLALVVPVLLAACSSGSDAPPPDPSAAPVPFDDDTPGLSFPVGGGGATVDDRITFEGVALISRGGSAGVSIRGANGAQGTLNSVICNVAAIGPGGDVVGRAFATWDALAPGEIAEAEAVFVGIASQSDYDYAEWTCSWS